jgi:hypothetical protein
MMKKRYAAAIVVGALVGGFIVGWLAKGESDVPPKALVTLAHPKAPVVPASYRSLEPSSHVVSTAVDPLPAPRGASYFGRPALPPVLEPVARGQVAWNTRPEEWKNVGRATVGSAIQTQYWSISRGAVDELQKSIVLETDSREQLESLLAQVSPEIRGQYPTIESLAAFLLASAPALGGIAIGQIQSERSSENEVAVSVSTLEPGAPRFGGSTQRFRKSPDGEWHRVIGPAEVRYWSQMIKWDGELSKSRSWVVSK